MKIKLRIKENKYPLRAAEVCKMLLPRVQNLKRKISISQKISPKMRIYNM
jgi:hypothetical protein